MPVQASPRMRLRFSGVRTRRAELDAVLQGPDVVRVAELNELEAVGFLHVLDPLVGLALRVYHQGPPSRVPGRAERESGLGHKFLHSRFHMTASLSFVSNIFLSFLEAGALPEKLQRPKLTQILPLLGKYYSL